MCCLDTARKHIAVRVDRDFRPGVPVVEKIKTARPRVTEIIGERSARKSVLPCAAAWPEFSNPRVFVGAKHIVQRPLLDTPLMTIGSRVCLAHPTILKHCGNLGSQSNFLVAFHSNVEVIHA